MSKKKMKIKAWLWIESDFGIPAAHTFSLSKEGCELSFKQSAKINPLLGLFKGKPKKVEVREL